MRKVEKTYLGNQVFAEFDGFTIKLTAENEVEINSEIYLDPKVIREFQKFIKRIIDSNVVKIEDYLCTNGMK